MDHVNGASASPPPRDADTRRAQMTLQLAGVEDVLWGRGGGAWRGGYTTWFGMLLRVR